jgi:hypothetical protein
VANHSSAQNLPKSFSEDQTQFITDLTKYYESLYDKDKRKEGRELLEKFTLQWNAPFFTNDLKNRIIKISNLMLKFKMRPFPHFEQFLTATMNFQNINPDAKSVDSWFLILEKSFDVSSNRKFLAFLEISINLFKDNVLYSSSATKWKANNNAYTFSYDSVPRVVFPSLNLTCYANDDSSVIYNTSGIYYPTTYLWVGNGGKVNWKRAGFDDNVVFAELNDYRIGIKFSKFSADSVKFTNKQFFESPLQGAFEEKILANNTEERASYPRFNSYDVRMKINNLFKDIDYEGGFSMNGARVIGSGNKEKDALLFFKREGKIFIVCGSRGFGIRKDRITSQRSSVTIYWEEDSIYHPGLELKYIDKSREISLIRQDEGLAMSPYYNTYHALDMYCEAVYWKMDEPKIDFTMIKGPGRDGNAMFESANYYRENRILKLQGIDDINPLDVIFNYSKKYKSREIFLNELTAYMRKPIEQVKAMLLNLTIRGFLIYNLDDDKAFIKDRLFNYLNARAKRTDYDVIQFSSSIASQPNATLSLLNFDLRLRGVPMVYLSDSQKVYIYPDNEELLVKKNRDFLFSGRVHAGLFDFFAKDCSFEYARFKLNMPTVDSLSFMVHEREKNEYGEYPLVRVKTVIRSLSGDLLIDHPNNKSGTTPHPEYPIFNSKGDAYVYYDGFRIQRGVYKRDKFFFHVYPFSIGNLDNFETQDIKFEGYLVSAGIFPDIEEPLKVQEDYSLGFIKNTPSAGLPVYGGVGTFINQINLSHKGLKGNGTIQYLVSTSESQDFTFYPDSVNARLQKFNLLEQTASVQYPDVKGVEVAQHWMPYKDLMILSTDKNPLELYNGQTKLSGDLMLSSSALSGAGLVQVADAEMDSKNFKFKNIVFDADTANFRLKTYDLKDLAFSTHNYKSHIDFKERKGEFKSNGGGSKVDFPVNQYICYMDEFEWFMDKEEIALSNSKGIANQNTDQKNIRELVDIDISGSEFVSVHPKQDSLRFFSPRAKYNLRNNIIYAEQVSFIKVADAAIFPDQGKVTIFKEAKMQTLNNAKILANTVTKYHEIDKAIVDIQSRKSFTGVGNYYYQNDKAEKIPFYLDKVYVDSTLQTNAHGRISDSLNFKISEQFDFAGDIRIKASREFLNFAGGYRIKNDCDTIPKAWVRFDTIIDPKAIILPVHSDLRDIANKNLFAALAFSQKSNHIYPAFLTKKENYSDQDLISARGIVEYDGMSDEYRIGSLEKLRQPILPGNILSINRRACILHGEGKINMGAVFGQLKLNSFGAVDYFIIPDSASFDMMMSLDFFFAENAMKLMVESLKEANLSAADLSTDKFKKALSEIVGIKDAEDLISEISLYGSMKRIPSELNHTFLFSDIKMKWNPNTNSFVSGNSIGLASMEKNQINKYVKGYVEITKKRSGDILDLYIEIDDNKWYYFNYSRGLMQAISSNNDFNIIITELKPDKRTQKGEKGEENYRFNIATVKKKKDFLKRMEGSVE